MNASLLLSPVKKLAPQRQATYRVVLATTQEVLLQRATLGEASSWANTYNQVMLGTDRVAVVEQERALSSIRQPARIRAALGRKPR